MTGSDGGYEKEVIDLFAGPGGWDVGARSLGIDPLGIEFDDAACATRAAAGLRTVQGDVAGDPVRDDLPLWGLIASPPCQTFSAAGKGAGRSALDDVLLAVDMAACGLPACEFDDPRTALVVQPLRYALLHEPEWIAWEQVPPVLPVWEACADVLRAEGYSVWTGNLHAEQYGVPQTRKRAVLMASRTRTMERPTPTHSRYYPRTPDKLDPGVAKWVSMAEALGWGLTSRPSTTVLTGANGGGSDPMNGGSGMRATIRDARQSGRFVEREHAFLRNNTSANAAVRRDDQPAPTLYFGGRSNGVYWEPGPGQEWTTQRPATTIVASFRPDVVAAPGWRKAGDGPRQNATGSVRVTVDEAATLQSFPSGYPWQGTRSKQYQQVGNAIPPLLAAHILSSVTGVALPMEAAA